MRENLLASVEAFSSPSCRLKYENPYRNKRGIWGRSYVIYHGGQFHKLSVSNCEKSIPTLLELSKCVAAAEELDPNLWGFYENRKSAPGYYATFKSNISFDREDHWFMLGRSSDWLTILRMQSSSRVSGELKEILDYLVENKISLKPGGN